MTLFKRTLHWTGAIALAGVISASFLAPSTALAEERDSFKLAWTIYAGWMPWKYADESGIMDKWADKYDIDVEITQINDYICLLYTSPSPRDKRQSRMPSSA